MNCVFSLQGMRHESEEGKLLGMFFYNYEGNPIQTFKVMVRITFSLKHHIASFLLAGYM